MSSYFLTVGRCASVRIFLFLRFEGHNKSKFPVVVQVLEDRRGLRRTYSGICVARFTPAVIKLSGYLCRCRNIFNSSRRLDRKVLSVIHVTVQIHRSKLTGIVRFVWEGWHDLKSRYRCVSMGLQ